MELDTSYIHLCIQDGILIGTYKKNIHINLELAKQIVIDRIAFAGGKIMPSIIRSNGGVSIDRAARQYLSSAEGTAGLSASAIVANSPFHLFLGNFFTTVNQTKMPVKIFSDMEQAKEWLQQFKVR